MVSNPVHGKKGSHALGRSIIRIFVDLCIEWHRPVSFSQCVSDKKGLSTEIFSISKYWFIERSLWAYYFLLNACTSCRKEAGLVSWLLLRKQKFLTESCSYKVFYKCSVKWKRSKVSKPVHALKFLSKKKKTLQVGFKRQYVNGSSVYRFIIVLAAHVSWLMKGRGLGLLPVELQVPRLLEPPAQLTDSKRQMLRDILLRVYLPCPFLASHPRNSPGRWVPLLPPFYLWGDYGPGRLVNLPKVTSQ